MTQDNDDLLAQVFSVLPTLEGQTDVNSNSKEEQEIVRRVSNAFQDFIEKTGVVETNVVSYEHHTESNHHVTSHVETHHETVTIGGGIQAHHEHHHEIIGSGAALAEPHEESHVVRNGVSVISTELNPPAHEEHHFTVSTGVVPQADDNESLVSVRTGLSEATSVSVHSSVSQKSIQIYADAPVIVKSTSRGSLASHKSSVVPESHHSETAHTHERESTISTASAKSETSTLTGSAASGNTAIENYVFVENTGKHHEHNHHEHHHYDHEHHHEIHHQHHGSQDTATPIAVMKSDPHDALLEEFKARHQRVPSEVSSFVPTPVESDDESQVVMTVKVTQYEFDSHDVKHAVEHHHEHHEQHVHQEEPIQTGYIHQDEPEHHFEDHAQHNGFDSHVVLGHGAAPHHTDEEEFHYETVEYHEQAHHQPEPASLYHDNVSVAPSEPRSEIPPVFFQSPVLARKAPQQIVNHYDSNSEVSSHHGHHHHHQHEDHHHDHSHIHRELIPNISGPFVRDDLRPAHVLEEHRTVTVSKTISAPVAHVQPVVSHPVVHHHHHQESRGLPRIDHREILIPHVEEVAVAHKIDHHVEHHNEVRHHHHDHHEHHHVHNEKHIPRSERRYHKHDDQMTEIFSGPSVRDLKSQFEQGGEVKVHYGTHYISHKKQTSAPIHAETLHHHDDYDQDDKHHHHEEHVHEHHEPAPVVVSVGQPRLPHRELKEEHVHAHHHHHHHPEQIHTHVNEHAHHHHYEHKEDHHHHHHNHEEPVHHHEHLEHHPHEHHQYSDHHEHHHEPHVETHQYVAEEEDQLPVSALLGRFGGGAKLRRPDHAEVISRASSVPNVTVVEEVHHHDVEVQSRTASRPIYNSPSVSTRGARSQSTYSVQTSQTRSHASTLTLDHHNHVVAAAPAPVATPRSPVTDHTSLRVVKSVRAFVSEWGQKDFQPPMSPIITVPRLPSSPKSTVSQPIPEPATRKSTVLSNVSNATHTTHQSHTPEHHAIQHIERALHDDAGSVCSQCTKSNRGKSVSTVASTGNYTTTSHHQEPVVVHIGEGTHPQIPEVHEEFVLTPLAERRALFEQGLNRGYSINRKTHGELPPMVNVFTD